MDREERPLTDELAALLGELATVVDDLVLAIGHMDHPLHFEEAGPKGPSATGRRRGGISFGIMPDFAGVVKDGLRADFVIEGRPAALAGMKDGDVIVAINGKSVKNIDDYMYRLSQLKPGQTVNVEVKRGDRSLILLIQL